MPRRKKAQPRIEVKCDHCGEQTETFVVDINHKRFCRHQYVGHPPDRDCMTDYYKEKRNAKALQKEKQEEGLQPQKEISFQERQKVKAKFAAYLKQLKQKSYEKKI